MGASASRREPAPGADAAHEPAPDVAADTAPEPKRVAPDAAPEPAPKRAAAATDPFRELLGTEGNASALLKFAGYRTVLTLETLSWRARRAVRGARLELDVTHESVQRRLLRIFHRVELLDLRRQGDLPKQIVYSVTQYEDGWQTRAAGVLYEDGGRVILLWPSPRRLHGVRGVHDRAGKIASTPRLRGPSMSATARGSFRDKRAGSSANRTARSGRSERARRGPIDSIARRHEAREFQHVVARSLQPDPVAPGWRRAGLVAVQGVPRAAPGQL